MEAVRKAVVGLVFVVFWMILLEGVFRKWVSPGYSKVIFFLKDPIVLAIYALVLRYRLWPPLNPLSGAAWGLMVLFVPLLVIQVCSLHLNPMVCIYGYRQYFFCVPLAFIMGYLMRGNDVKYLVWQALITTLPMAILIYLQWHSPIDSVINCDTTNGEIPVMTLVSGIVRPAGTFSDSMMIPCYAGLSAAFAMALSILPLKRLGKGLYLLVPAGLAILVMIAFTGNRATHVYVGLVFLFALVGAGFLPSVRNRARSFSILLVILFGAVFLSMTFFAEGLRAMADRVNVAKEAEGPMTDRAMTNITRSKYAFDDYKQTVIGYGMGMGSGGGAIMALGKRQMPLGETEWLRVINETSISGMLYLAWRTLLALWIFWNAALAVRRTGNTLPMTLCGLTMPLLFVGQVTMTGPMNYFCWFVVGVNLAANNLGLMSVLQSNERRL